jgi:hypothetical protein
MNLINTNNGTDTVEEKPAPSFESLLSEYGQPAETKEQQTETNESVGKIDDDTRPSWEGNPAYFQTGKRAGQKRPNRARLKFVPGEEVSEIDGELITGALFLSMIDLLLPLLIAGIHNGVTKKKENRLKWNDLQMSAEQKKQLSPIADRVVKMIKLEGHPILIMSLTMLGLYGLNYATARMENSMKK